MVKMKSDRPLYVGGEAVNEFETDEQHARELEQKGLAQRVPEAQSEQQPASPPEPKQQPAEPKHKAVNKPTKGK